MTRAALVVAAGMLLALLPVRADDAHPPGLLQRLLQTQKAWRLLDPRHDLPSADADTLAILAARVPWIVHDFDRDGDADVAAVVVSGLPPRLRYGVVAVHARAPRIPRWVVPLHTDAIVGVSPGPAGDTVEADYCTECDAQPWFRWSGRDYELGLYAMGDRVALGDANGVPLLAFPRASAPRRAVADRCASARVHDVAGTPGKRWYFVETTAPPTVRGWVPAAFVVAGDDCY